MVMSPTEYPIARADQLRALGVEIAVGVRVRKVVEDRPGQVVLERGQVLAAGAGISEHEHFKRI
jgi:hypothetical protein